jgi:hypothetical protein
MAGRCQQSWITEPVHAISTCNVKCKKNTYMCLNKWLAGTARVLAMVTAVFVTWLHAAAPAATPTVGAASASPAYVVVNTPTAVIITTTITDSTLLANGVNLLQTDANGKTLGTIGVMHDDGLSGDAKAGDKVFSYQVTVSQTDVGRIYFRASAAFKSVLQRVLSNVVSITLDPFKLPPDPGDVGKQELAGIDSDHDGVRDDVQRYIAIQFLNSRRTRAAASQYATALEDIILAAAEPSIVDASSNILAATRCYASIVGVTQAYDDTNNILLTFLNTDQRKAAYDLSQQALSGRTFDSPSVNELRQFCNFNVDALPN